MTFHSVMRCLYFRNLPQKKSKKENYDSSLTNFYENNFDVCLRTLFYGNSAVQESESILLSCEKINKSMRDASAKYWAELQNRQGLKSCWNFAKVDGNDRLTQKRYYYISKLFQKIILTKFTSSNLVNSLSNTISLNRNMIYEFPLLRRWIQNITKGDLSSNDFFIQYHGLVDPMVSAMETLNMASIEL